MPSTTTRQTIPRSEQFHALADETRLQILELLRGGEHCVCELTDALELGQSLLSFHLKTLKAAGLVVDRREGRWMYYALEENALRAMAAGLTKLVASQARKPLSRSRCD